jgi:cytochrome c biogenesis protein
MTAARLWLRRGWRKLISMRTALVLLFLLAIASVPGSLLPQRPLNPENVSTYLRQHGAWGTFLDKLGFFDVFGSVWFSAIYLLLFVSLVGCLLPRIRVHLKALRVKPLPAPKRLTRLPESASFDAGTADAAVLAGRARQVLGRRWRSVVREEADGSVSVSAEKGYSRETGNIVFHVALLVALVLVAVGRLFHYQGSVIVTEGDQFCNTVAAYDSWQPGRVAADGGIAPAPFCVKVDDFTAKYLDTGEPTSFASDITYYRVEDDGSDGASRSDVLRVNHPLRLDGDRLYLISHGFTPIVTATLPSGRTVTEPANFLPQDNTTYLSEGVFALPDAHDDDAGTPRTDIGLQAIFAPTPSINDQGLVTSVSPQAKDPVLGVQVFQGDLNDRDGVAKSIYTIDTSKMTKTGQANLTVGQTQSFPNGVSVRFDGYEQWVALQVSHDPTQGWLLVAAVAMVAGLIGSLAVRRRRVWVRVRPGAGGPTLVTVGGLARSDSGNFTEEFAALAGRLREALAPPEPTSGERLVDATTTGGSWTAWR